MSNQVCCALKDTNKNRIRYWMIFSVNRKASWPNLLPYKLNKSGKSLNFFQTTSRTCRYTWFMLPGPRKSVRAQGGGRKSPLTAPLLPILPPPSYPPSHPILLPNPKGAEQAPVGLPIRHPPSPRTRVALVSPTTAQPHDAALPPCLPMLVSLSLAGPDQYTLTIIKE